MTDSANPDLPPVINLLLSQYTEQAMIDSAVAAVNTRLTWIPQEGNIESILLESTAVIVAQLLYNLNQIPKVVLDGIIALYGLNRHSGTPVAGTVSVTMASSTDGAKTVPSGATFRVTLPDSSTLDLIATTAVTQVPGDGLTFSVPVMATTVGSAANGLPSGTDVQLVDSLSWVESVTLGTALAGGTDLEVDADFYPRAKSFLTRQSLTLVTASHFASAALDVDGVGRSVVFNNWDGSGTFGAQPGNVTVAVATPAGGACASGVKTAVTSELTAGAIASLSVHVVDPVSVKFTITASVVTAAGYASSDVHDRVVAAITAFVDPAGWAWGAQLLNNALVVVVGTVPGVAAVTSIGGSSVGASRGRLDLPDGAPAITVTAT